MEALRVAAAKTAPTATLSWREDDPIADWTLKLGAGSYKVHSAVIASGQRRSDKVRKAIVEQNGGGRVTDVGPLLPDASRAAILSDPHVQTTFELMLDWMYGNVEALALPTFVPGKVITVGAAAAAPTNAAAAKPAGGGDPRTAATPGGTPAGAEAGEEDSMLNFFSTAIFGPSTPNSKAAESGTTPKSASKAAATLAAPAAPVTASVASKATKVRPEQVPLLWSLADCLQVRGLKTALLPLFEDAPLEARFTMLPPAYERLKMLVRALELHCSEIVAALREQLRLASMTEGITSLAVAASACDLARYEQLTRCGLLPSDDKGLLAVLDQTHLRVASEAQIYDLICHHIATTKASAAAQEALWATCRFTYLPTEQMVKIAELPHVPPRWLALACAQRAAGPGGSGAAAGNEKEAARLQPRSYYSS